MRHLRVLLIASLAACGSSSPAAIEPVAPNTTPPPAPAPAATQVAPPPPGPPVAARRPVTDTYHGVSVVDDYRWLEADDDAVRAWSAGENQFARGVLDHLPGVDALRGELRAILTAPVDRYYRFAVAGGALFCMVHSGDHEQPELVVIADPTRPAAKVIFDPVASGDAQQVIDWFVPSPDGKRVAVSISTGGSEHGALHVLDLAGVDVEPVIDDVQRGTGGGAAAWTPDGKGLYYTRYPRAGDKPEAERDFWMQVWFHQLGTPVASDRYELGNDLPKIAEIGLAADARGRVLASVQDGDGGTFRHYLRDRGAWRRLDDWSDGVVDVAFGPTRELWLVSRAGAPRGKILALAGDAKSAASARVIVPERTDSIVTDFDAQRSSIIATRDRLYVTYQLGGPSEIRAFTFAGKPVAQPALPPVSSARLEVAWGRGVLYSTTTYTTPDTKHLFDEATGAVTDLPAISSKPTADLSGFDVIRDFATSKDGTKVPLSIVWPRGAANDGARACVVTGYGGYGISTQPHYLASVAPLLTRGVCWVDVNLRGGSEFGEAWHRAGALTHKQNVFDDFAAVLQHVVAARYTSADRLGILGGSNGGLLMGAIITQHPELVHAVVALVGIYDMLRVESSPNGAYNTTEFGTVNDPEQFAALYAYSPYHHVARGSYPAILMATGANDPRVAPWQSRKMVAALQAAQTGTAPILLRTSTKAGHGIGSSISEQVDLSTDIEAFLLAQLAPR